MNIIHPRDIFIDKAAHISLEVDINVLRIPGGISSATRSYVFFTLILDITIA